MIQTNQTESHAEGKNISKELPTSKWVNFETFKAVNRMPFGHSMSKRMHSDYRMEDLFYVVNQDYYIESIKSSLEYAELCMKNEKDYIEFLDADLIHYMEEDEDTRMRQDGTFFTSYNFDQYKKESQKLKKNTQSRIYRLKSKIEGQRREIECREKLQKLFIALPEKRSDEV